MLTESTTFCFRRIETSLLIAKTEPFSCEILSQLLQKEGFNVLGSATELDELLTKIRTKKPKFVIVEQSILEHGIEQLTRQFRAMVHPPKLIVYLNKESKSDIPSLMAANYSGYMHTTDKLDELYRCIEAVQKQPQFFSSTFRGLMSPYLNQVVDADTHSKVNSLTRREKQILRLIVDGMTGIEISDMLFISYRTLANHKQNIANKLGVESNRQILKVGLRIKPYLNR